MESRFALQLTQRRALLGRFEHQRSRWVQAEFQEFEVEAPLFPRNQESLMPLAGQLGKLLRDKYPSGISARLVIPASWCLLQRMESIPAKWTEAAALFAFERYLPVELETLTCVAARIHPTRAIVGGVPTGATRGFLTVLHEHGVSIELAAIDALLFARRGQEAPAKAGVLLLDERHMTMLCIGNARTSATIMRKVVLPECENAILVIEQTLRSAALWHAPDHTWQVLPLSPNAPLRELTEAVEKVGGRMLLTPPAEAIGCILEQAANAQDLLDLRRGELAYAGRWQLARTRASRCALAALVILVFLIAWLCRHSNAYAAALDRLRPLPATLYAQVMPGASIPPGAALRLRSERIKLEALTEHQGSQGPARPSSGLAAFELLHEMMLQIPSDLKLNVSEILLDDQGVRMAGQTVSHSAAGQLVQRLNKIPHLVVSPPRTKLRKDQTVDFHLHAKRASEGDHD